MTISAAQNHKDKHQILQARLIADLLQQRPGPLVDKMGHRTRPVFVKVGDRHVPQHALLFLSNVH